MLKFVLILLIGLSNLPKTTPCVVLYGQCGGKDWNGETACCSGSTCIVGDLYYSQCKPSSTSSTTGCSTLYQQCGGQNWLGPTCCVDSICIVSDSYYSQCRPALPSSSGSISTTQSGSSTSPSSTTASTSKSPSSTTASTSSSSTSSTNQGCSALYGQCGGKDWTGPRTCCSGSTCIFGNDYYSQCLASGGSSSSPSSSGSSTASPTTISSGNENFQSGVTTRYWDCCKPSCGWPGKASVTHPVQICAQNGDAPITDANTPSGCDGGPAYTCNNQQPWSVNSSLSYGHAAARINGQRESDWCCACYLLKFTSGPVNGKVMIVQVTNTGGDLGNNHFDLQMPGGGVGLFDGCSRQFPGYSGGDTYGGVSQRSACDSLPAVIRPGCYWRFDWFMGADNPTMNFKQVPCPSALTDNTQCIRN